MVQLCDAAFSSLHRLSFVLPFAFACAWAINTSYLALSNFFATKNPAIADTPEPTKSSITIFSPLTNQIISY